MTVRLRDLSTGVERTVALVDRQAADREHGRYSAQSPLGRAIIGHQAGETITVTAPRRALRYEIIEILP